MINLGKLFFLNSKNNFLQEEKEEKVTYNWCHAIRAPLQNVMNIPTSWDTVLFHVINSGPLSFSFMENVFILPINVPIHAKNFLLTKNSFTPVFNVILQFTSFSAQ